MEHFDRRAFIKLGSLSLFGFMTYGDILRLRAQSPAKDAPQQGYLHHSLVAQWGH